MPNESDQKGRTLEKAVRLIQETILESDPQLKGAPFSIETRKIIITPDGVRHEVDVYVKTLPGSPYESTCIFECKNWNAPVDKNEVIVLTEKVRATGATRGWIVAKELTSYAEMQMKTDRRLGFIRCTNDFLSPLDSMELVHSVRDLLPIKIALKQRGIPAKERPDELDWKNTTCRNNGAPVELQTYVERQIDRMVAEDDRERSSEYGHEGVHWSWRADQIRFHIGEFTLDETDVEHMTIEMTSFVSVTRRKILSKFELSGHGQVFSFELDDVVPGKAVEISVVCRI